MNVNQQFEQFSQDNGFDRPGFGMQVYNPQKTDLFLKLIGSNDSQIEAFDDLFNESINSQHDQVEPGFQLEQEMPKPIKLDVSKLSKVLDSSSINSTATRRATSALSESVEDVNLDSTVSQTLAELESGRGKMAGIDFIAQQRRRLQQFVCREAQDKFHSIKGAMKMALAPEQLLKMVEKTEYDAVSSQQRLSIAIERRTQLLIDSTEPQRAQVAAGAINKQLENEVKTIEAYVEAETQVKEQVTKLANRLDQVMEKTREPYVQAASIILDYGDEITMKRELFKEITKHVAQTTADQQMEEYMAQDDQLNTIFDIEESFGLVKTESIKRAIQTAVDFTPRSPNKYEAVTPFSNQPVTVEGTVDACQDELEKIKLRDYSGKELIEASLINDVYAKMQN